MLNKRPLNRINSFLEVNLDEVSKRGSFSTIIPEELLQKIYVVSHMAFTQPISAPILYTKKDIFLSDLRFDLWLGWVLTNILLNTLVFFTLNG
jgi:hypothetical protein